jgi:hypothetical protein
MFRAISFAMLLCLTVSTKAAEIGIIQQDSDTAIITVTGGLEGGDDREFAQAALQYQNAVVKLDSPGGLTLVGIELGKAIRLKGFSTMVDQAALCASACGYAWLGGVRREWQPAPELAFMLHTYNKTGKTKKMGSEMR